MEQLESYRQSLIATFDSCTQRALFSLQDERRTPSVTAARGTLFHRFVHHAVKKMWETGERTYPVDMAMEDLANHVLPQTDVPSDEVVPITMEQMKWLRVLVVVWCENARIDTRRTLAAEERYYAGLPLPSGETVQVTGQLDLLVADPPDGVTVIDYKSGFGKPPEPKNEERAENEGTGLTALGWAQWLIYSFLMFENFPNVQRVAFREVHVLRWKEAQAKMERWEMERLRDVLASQVALLHRAIQEGPESGIWTPTAGSHCSMCANPRACPIKDVMGIPATYEEAQRLVQEWHVAGVIREERAPLIKGWVDQYGDIEFRHARGRRVVGYQNPGSRALSVFEPRETPESPYDEALVGAARDAGVLVE